MRREYEQQYNIIVGNMRRVREERNLTQVELAEALGISVSYLTKIESFKGKKTFSIELLMKYAEVLDVDIRDFFAGLEQEVKCNDYEIQIANQLQNQRVD